jgi:hypothetical protein
MRSLETKTGLNLLTSNKIQELLCQEKVQVSIRVHFVAEFTAILCMSWKGKSCLPYSHEWWTEKSTSDNYLQDAGVIKADPYLVSWQYRNKTAHNK